MKKYLLVATLLLAGAPLAWGGAPAIPPPAPSPKPSATCGDSGHALAWNGTAYTCQAITGGSAAAGGSNTQLNYNQGGALAGITGATTDGTSVIVSSGNLKLSGATSGTAIVNAPGTGGGTLTLPPGSDTIAGIAATQTLTNKTLTSPAINTPTGIVKGDVGLGNVDNTSDATKNAASVTLTNKTISGAANTLTVRAASDVTGTLPVANGGTGITALGTGVATALGQNVSGTGAICLASGSSCSGGGGSGTVTSVTGGAGISLSTDPCTATCTVSTTWLINAQTGTSYTVLSSDAAKLVTFSNASAVACTIPQGTGSFGAGFAFDVQNKGAGLVTCTPNTSTINGAATLTIPQNMGCAIVSDGTNWQVSACMPAGTLPVSKGGTGLSSGTSGGVLAYTASGTLASSGALTANLPVIGGGAGSAPTVGTRSGNTTAFATVTGTLTNGDCVSIDASGNFVDAGGACTTGGGGGTVNSGTSGQMAYYGSTGTAVSGNGNVTVTSGTLTLGTASTTQGNLKLNGGTSGSTTISPTGTAGTTTATLPANTGAIAELNLAQTWSALQSFNNADLSLNGSSSGATVLNAAAAAGSTTATLPSNTGTIAELNLAQNWTAQQSNCITTLTISTTTFTPDGTCNNYKLTLTGADTVANPSATPVAGTAGIIAVIQDGTGSRTITWGSQYIAAGGVSTLTLSTGANAQDYISYYVIDSTHVLLSMGALNATH